MEWGAFLSGGGGGVYLNYKKGNNNFKNKIKIL
jgi:hypothetical protein